MRVPMDRSDKAALRRGGRRFVWMTLGFYTGLTVGVWAAHAVLPGFIGALTDDTIKVSLVYAIAFGGLYAAAGALRQISKPAGRSAPADATVVREGSKEPQRRGGRRKSAKPDEGTLRSEQVWAELQDLENIR